MKVRLSELRELSTKLFDHLEAIGATEFEITDDYYWTIPQERRYDPTCDPTDFELEQLTDNWNWLASVRTGRSEPIAFQLVWLAAFLQWIGEHVVR